MSRSYRNGSAIQTRRLAFSSVSLPTYSCEPLPCSLLRIDDIPPGRSPQDEPTGEGDVVAAVEPFHPTFTYPIFGEREKIFGYKQIQIEVRTGTRDEAETKYAC